MPINITKHVKIWFSSNPDEFLPLINKQRLIDFRECNSSHEITLVGYKALLSEESQQQLGDFCDTYNINYLDLENIPEYTENMENMIPFQEVCEQTPFREEPDVSFYFFRMIKTPHCFSHYTEKLQQMVDKFFPFLKAPLDKNFVAVGMIEMAKSLLADDSSSGTPASMTAASDILRFHPAIMELGIYSDLDVIHGKYPADIELHESELLLNCLNSSIVIKAGSSTPISFNSDFVAMNKDHPIAIQTRCVMQLSYVYHHQKFGCSLKIYLDQIYNWIKEAYLIETEEEKDILIDSFIRNSDDPEKYRDGLEDLSKDEKVESIINYKINYLATCIVNLFGPQLLEYGIYSSVLMDQTGRDDSSYTHNYLFNAILQTTPFKEILTTESQDSSYRPPKPGA